MGIVHPLDQHLNRRLEDLLLKTRALQQSAGGSLPILQAARTPFGRPASDLQSKGAHLHAAQMAVRLAETVMARTPVFGLEPWHALGGEGSSPAEMLLRVKDQEGRVLSPYPAIMAFYGAGLTVALDTVLFLSALREFREHGEKQVSINISAQSLQDADFVETALGAVELAALGPEEKIILEIHESGAGSMPDRRWLRLLRRYGVGFAIDDVGVTMDDVMRLSAFERLADFIKIDRRAIENYTQGGYKLGRIMDMARTLLPEASVVAEGIRSPHEAISLRAAHPGILYAQGMYLPDRATFQKTIE